MIDLSSIPHANKYDYDDGYACWAIGDPEKSQDIWHTTVKDDAYAVIDIVLPVNQLRAGGYNPFPGQMPGFNPAVPIWIAYRESISCSVDSNVPLPEWVSEVLQPQLKPWDGIKRDHAEESINQDRPPVAL